MDQQERIVKKVEQLEDVIKKIQGRTEDKVKQIGEKQKSLIEKLEDAFRKTKITDEVVRLREKASKNPEVNFFLERYHISLDDIALVTAFERSLGGYFDDERFVLRAPLIGVESVTSFIYGGPRDGVRLLFNHSKNGQYIFQGIMVFPERLKGGPKRDLPALFRKIGRKKAA